MSVGTYLELREYIEGLLAGFSVPVYMVDQPFDPPPLSENGADPAAYVVCDPIRVGYAETITATKAGEISGDVCFIIYVDKRTGDAPILTLAEELRTLFLAASEVEGNLDFTEPRPDRAMSFTGDDAGRLARQFFQPFHWVRG